VPKGIVLIDKPQGFTSHDVVAKLRKVLGTKKIGHAGTLDSMATGLLVLGVESGTKLLQFLVGVDKQYLATIRLGQNTTTDDAEGEVINTASANHLVRDQIEQALANFRGEIQQVPSQVSAIKVAGKRAYDLVREGKEVELAARKVTISKFELLSDPKVTDDFLDLEVIVDCSSGTYIRALARDLGALLGVGGHLIALRRTEVGQFSIADAIPIDAEPVPLSMERVAAMLFEVVDISADQARDLVHGKKIILDSSSRLAALYQGRLIAILEKQNQHYRSLVVFPEALNG
jgi:tRNA pseudouridine55 synthase